MEYLTVNWIGLIFGTISCEIIGFIFGIAFSMFGTSVVAKKREVKRKKILRITKLLINHILPNIAIHKNHVIIYLSRSKEDRIESKSNRQLTRENKVIKLTTLELTILNKIVASEFQEKTLIENEIINNPIWTFSVTDKSSILSSALKMCVKKGYVWKDTVLGGEVCSLTKEGREVLLKTQKMKSPYNLYISKRDYPKFHEYV